MPAPKNYYDETRCGTNECGYCKIPNPMNTNTKKRTLLGLAITQSPRYQKSLVKRFGITRAKQKALCEYNRVRNIAEKKYNIKVRKKFSWKLKEL